MAIVEVASDRDPTVRYAVDLETGECQCPAYQKRLKELNEKDGGARRCKHYLRATEGKREGQ